MKVRLRLVKKTSSVLGLVKILKDQTHLGLKDAKFLVDTLHGNGYPASDVEFELLPGLNQNDLIKSLSNIDGYYQVNGGIQSERNKKILELGIGTVDDYSEFIADHFIFNSNKVKDSASMLKDILSKLDKEQLELIFNKIKDENSEG